MALRWYAITSKIKTKDKFLKEIIRSNKMSPLHAIKDVIIYDFSIDDLDLGHEDSLLKGYALIQLEEKSLKDVVKVVESSKIGEFIGVNSKGNPYPVPKNEVCKFQTKVKRKREKFSIGDKVAVTEGILKGFDGIIVKKNKLMVGVEVKLDNNTILR